MPNHYPEHYPTNEKMFKIVIWHIFWEIWTKGEKKSEMKPPLIIINVECGRQTKFQKKLLISKYICTPWNRTSIVTCQLFFILPVSNQDTQLKRMGLATLPRILCAFDVFDTPDDGCRFPIHVLIRGLHKGNRTFFELDLKLYELKIVRWIQSPKD